MLRFIKKSLTLKIVIALATILLITFTALCFSILNKQNGLLGRMTNVVSQNLVNTSNQAKEQFGKLEADVRLALDAMSSQVAANLSSGTEKSLKQEEANIQQAMVKLLQSNAKALAGRFQTLQQDNDTSIKNVLNDQSAKVIGQLSG